MSKILIIGGAGYIGSVLDNQLKYIEHPMVYDNFLYEKSKEYDIRNLSELYPFLEQADVVVNLAGLSNDPLSDLDPDATWEINYKANEPIAKLLRNSGKKVIYISSCSVYGFGNEEFTEKSKINPQTLYARTKALSEELYLHQDLDSVVLRLATVYGFSPKPRFDLVVNKMIGDSYFNNKITVNGGDQWRPIVHVRDVARAIKYSIDHLKGGIYNVGSNDQNFKIGELGLTIGSLTNTSVEVFKGSMDHRSYRVNFDKIHNEKYYTIATLNTAVDELYTAFKTRQIKNITDDVYYRVKYLKRRKHGLRGR